MDGIVAPMPSVRDASLALYLEAICATMRCQSVPGGRWRCDIPILERWAASHEREDRCRHDVESQVAAWAIRRVASGKPFPPCGGLRAQISDVVVPDTHTERLRLVPYTATLRAMACCDRAGLAARLGVHVDDGWAEMLPTLDPATSRQSYFEWLSVLWAIADPASAPWRWMIVERANQTLIGEIGTSNPPQDAPGEDSIQISYFLAPGYRGRGYMTEAARAYVAWAFAQPHVSWIFATTEVDNVASRRVLEKIGARPLAQDPTDGWLDWEILPNHPTPAITGP